jgi:hypothetical protein
MSTSLKTIKLNKNLIINNSFQKNHPYKKEKIKKKILKKFLSQSLPSLNIIKKALKIRRLNNLLKPIKNCRK